MSNTAASQPLVVEVVVNQYPFHLLPQIKDEGVHGPRARNLTEEEKTLLQSSFAWMQTSDTKIPRPTTASYSELCFMLLNLGQMRAFTKMAIDMRWDYHITPHKARYEATGQKHGFHEILNHDFSLLEEVLFNCADLS